VIRRILCVALLAVSTTACDEDALRLAKEARDVLVTYEKELARKIAAEQRAYAAQSQVMAVAHREQLASNLEQERMERARTLSLDLVENQLRVTRWREPLRAYANADYRVQRELLLADLGSEMGFVARIQALQIDKQKVRALVTALGALSEKIKFTDQVKAFAEFAEATKTDFEKQVCDSLAEQLKEANTAVKTNAGNPAELKKATAAKAAIEALRQEKSCP
jgi:hypothetical protein